MAKIRLGPPRELMTISADNLNINCFVETGTYYGDTANWASNKFESVKTVELSDDLYENVVTSMDIYKIQNFIKGSRK